MIAYIRRFGGHWRDFIQPTIVIIVAGVGISIGNTIGGPTGAMIGGGIGAASGLLFTVLQAVYDAMNEPEPFELSVDVCPPSASSREAYPSYHANLVVKSKLTAKHLQGCTLHVLEASEAQTQVQYPRLVEKFDVSPRSEYRATFAYWTSRDGPHKDDETIGVVGPVGGLNGNILKVATSGSKIKLEIRGPASHTQEVCCRVSLVGRSLCAELC